MKSTSYLLACMAIALSSTVRRSCGQREAMPAFFTTMPFENRVVYIYKYSGDMDNFFFSPLALLRHGSAASVLDAATQSASLRFDVQMWNEDVIQDVADRLEIFLRKTVPLSQVRILPLDHAVLTGRFVLANGMMHAMTDVWQPYNQEQMIQLSVPCPSLEDCRFLADEMRINPDHFSKLFLRFTNQLSDQVQTQHLSATMTSLRKGWLLTKLDRMFPEMVGQFRVVYMTDSDRQQLIWQSVAQIIEDELDHNKLLDLDSQRAIYRQLENYMFQPTEQDDQAERNGSQFWNWVLWPGPDKRPDVAADHFNSISFNLSLSGRQLLEKAFIISSSQPSSQPSEWAHPLWSDAALFENVTDFVQRHSKYVQWNEHEAKFVPKTIKFHKFQLDMLLYDLDQTRFDIDVTYSSSFLKTRIKMIDTKQYSPRQMKDNKQDIAIMVRS